MGACSSSTSRPGFRRNLQRPGTGILCIDRALFVQERAGGVDQFYSFEENKKLGNGTFGQVIRGTRRATGEEYAIKQVLKTDVAEVCHLLQEVRIMKTLDHPHIIRAKETFEDMFYINIVMELCHGGELYNRLKAERHFRECDTAIIMQQLFRAIAYMHQKDIVHRDLKPENIMLLNKAPISENTIKLIDFGTARPCTQKQVLATIVGTSFYIAPEVLLRRYGRECDMWSLGAMMYTMLSGCPPFYGKGDAAVLRKVRAAKYDFDALIWMKVSPSAKQLIKMLLHPIARARFTAKQALHGSWIESKAPRNETQLCQDDFENLSQWRRLQPLKKVALQVIAGQLKEPELKDLQERFVGLDEDGDGLVSVDEISKGFKESGLLRSKSSVMRVFASVDTNCSGAIDYSEFIAAGLDDTCYQDKETKWNAFNVFDIDGDGYISKDELSKLLRPGRLRTQTVDAMVDSADSDGDGRINFQEFSMMLGSVGGA